MRTSSLFSLALALFFTLAFGVNISHAICVTHADCDDGIACTNDSCAPEVSGADPITGCLNDPVDSNCDDGVFCNGRERCDPGSGGCVAGTPAMCSCSPGDYLTVCAEEFPRCDDYSLNFGAGCLNDVDCTHGRCERCQPSCTTNSDCDDGSRCSGTETCLSTCSGGPNNGNSCLNDSHCTPGVCLRQCRPGVSPCGEAHCADRVCQGVVPMQLCHSSFECPPGVQCANIPGPGFTCFSGTCGDGTISGAEECDPNANLPDPLYNQLPNGCFAGSTCRPDTDPFPCTCTPSCGNVNLEMGEECDWPGISACPGRCQTDCTCAPSTCGNGIVESNEECEEDCDCGGFPCRQPGDPVGECTCTCIADLVPPFIDWDSSLSSSERATRSLNFRIEGSPPGCEPELMLMAIQVTMVDLEHPFPAAYQPSVNPLPKNFTTFDTRSNGTCSNGDHAGHHCDTSADCRLCGGSGSYANKPCASDLDCTVGGQSNFCPTSVCTGDARRPCSLNSHCIGFGTCGSFISYTCSGLAACTGEAAMSPSGVGGCARWVGKPKRFREAQEVDMSPVDYLGARLQCTPYYHDWAAETATNPITVFGAEILPNSTFSVVAYFSNCKGAELGCSEVSAPVEMRTRRHGDVVSPFNPPVVAQQPDVTDIGQVVKKFKKETGAPSNSAALIQPNIPDPNTDVGVSDIVQVVDMAKQQTYPFGGPCPCPSLAVCGATPCPSGAGTCTGSGAPGLGAEATCIKLCRGGTNAGEQCNNHLHCGGGGVCDKECVGGTNNAQGCSGNGNCGKVCVSGPTPGAPCADASTCGGGTCPTINCTLVTNNAFCRDKCGRCSP